MVTAVYHINLTFRTSKGCASVGWLAAMAFNQCAM